MDIQLYRIRRYTRL